MSYVKESVVSTARRRRHRRATITLTLCVLLLLGTMSYAVAYYQGWVGAPATAACTPSPTSVSRSGAAPLPADVTVNVYNAGGASGLAGETARLLRSRGFTIKAVSNDPLRKTLAGVAEIRYGTSGAKAAKQVLATQLRGAKLVKDGRTDASVDLVVGKKFTRLLPAPPIDKRSSKTQPDC